MTHNHTTYHRTEANMIDGVCLWSVEADTLYNEQTETVDIVEEQRDCDGEILRYRTIRLGLPEPCDNDGCWGKHARNFPGGMCRAICPVCNGTNVKPRNENPEWTWTELGRETLPTDSLEAQIKTDTQTNND